MTKDQASEDAQIRKAARQEQRLEEQERQQKLLKEQQWKEQLLKDQQRQDQLIKEQLQKAKLLKEEQQRKEQLLKEKQRKEQLLKERQQKFKFSNISYKDYSDFELSVTENRSWYLHKSILQKRCPSLLSIDTQRLKLFNLPEKTYETLVTFIYQDELIKMEFLEMIDFHILTVLCEMKELGDYVVSDIFARCKTQGPDDIASAFSKLIKYPEFNTVLFDNLYYHVSQEPDSYEGIISAIMQGSESFVKLAMHRMLLSKNFKNPENIANPCGELHRVVQELFPSVDQKTMSSASSSKENNSDFTIICEGRKFPCHKLLLVLRWPYFEKVISFKGIETTTDTLEVPADTLSAAAMEVFLQYLYTNYTSDQVPASVAHNILINAKAFGMTQNGAVSPLELLITDCRAIVFQPLRVDNCIIFLKGALEYGTEDQVKQARTFISKLFGTSQLESIRSEFKTLSAEETHRLVTWGTK